MKFFMPVSVYEEADCVMNHRSELRSLGTRALIVTGRSSSKKNGSLADLSEALRLENVKFTVWDRIDENPSVESILEAKNAVLAFAPDFVIGLGGGSPMDAAKAIAVSLCYPEEGADFFYRQVPGFKHLPVAAIPTTCGTGSEVTAVSVLTRNDKRTKGSMAHRFFPEIALIDPKYLKGAPAPVIRNTSMDALAHLAESYINTNSTAFSRVTAEEGLRVWKKIKPVLTGDRQATDSDLTDLMNASLLAGISIAQAGTSLPHTLGYKLTYELGTPHGPASALFLAGYLREAEPADRDRVLNLAGFGSPEELQDFFGQVCGTVAVTPELLEETVNDTLANASKLKNAPFPVDREVLYRIISMSGTVSVPPTK